MLEFQHAATGDDKFERSTLTTNKQEAAQDCNEIQKIASKPHKVQLMLERAHKLAGTVPSRRKPKPSRRLCQGSLLRM